MNSMPAWKDLWGEAELAEALRLKGPIFVVGASGFIGANLFRSLSAVRGDVYACSRSPEKSWRLAGVASQQLINLDVTDFDGVRDVVQEFKPATVFNLAAYGAYSRQNDASKIHATNYMGSFNILKCLSEAGVAAYVHAGTSSEYGLNCAKPTEEAELIPNSDYAVSKVSASYLIKYFGRVFNFPGVNLRIYSVYGPWEERDRLIPTLILNGLAGKFPLFTDKRISRDFVYVDDCTNAMVKAALTLCIEHPGISINVATGVKTTIEEVAGTAQKVFKIPGTPVFGSMQNRRWDLAEWYGDPSLAERLLRWKAKTPFAEGIEVTARWEKEFAATTHFVVVPKSEKKLSVVVACYRDNESIPILYERLTSALSSSRYDYEIIFVNDSSPLNDEEVIARLCYHDNHVVGISHSRNFGSQSAFVSGMDLSTGDAVVLMDGDGQDPPEVIAEFIAKWEEGFDVVYGRRIKRVAPFYMQVFYKLFYRIFHGLSEVSIPVDAGDFSLIDRKVVQYLLRFTEKDIFLRGLRAWVGFKQTGVPYLRPERLFGRSTNSLAKNFWWAKKGIFSFSRKPLQYIQTLGLIVFFATILMSAFYLLEYFVNPPENARGVPTIILIMLGLGGFQLISISVLGDYLGKVIEEVKNRPKFIRSKVFYNGKTYTDEPTIMELLKKIGENRTPRGRRE